jgi:hypothetical protein
MDWTLALGALVVGVVVGLTGMGGGGLVVGMTSVGSGSLIIIALMGLYPTLRPCPARAVPHPGPARSARILTDMTVGTC